MAACCGVPTGRVDILAFGLGSGIAGLGAWRLANQGNVGPELGKATLSIVLVVVLGGVGTTCQERGCGVWAVGSSIKNSWSLRWSGSRQNQTILVLIILFIQKRPQGLFALKGEGY